MYEYFETSTLIVREKRTFSYNAESNVFDNPDVVSKFLVNQLQLDKKPQEEVWVILLDTKSRFVGYQLISKGTLSSSVVSVPDVFRPAILAPASAIILAHNHPSGDCNPSREDYTITQRIRESGKLLQIELLDHIVIGNECSFSFKERTDLL